jgi:hypothetical protein
MNLNGLWYALGFLVFVFGQAHNSLQSKSNALSGWSGYKAWFSAQAANLATRALFAFAGYSYAVQKITENVQAHGLLMTGAGLAAIAGFAGNGLLYQVFGALGFMRVETADIVPPHDKPLEAPGTKP